jgi:hypothetical protein
MKLVYGNGKVLEVRDAGPCLMKFQVRPGGPPIKVNGYRLLGDDEARDLVRDLLGSGLYDRVLLTEG